MYLLWHLDDFDLAGSANVEMTPGLSEVGLEPVGFGETVHLAVGLEDYVGSSSGGGFIHFLIGNLPWSFA